MPRVHLAHLLPGLLALTACEAGKDGLDDETGLGVSGMVEIQDIEVEISPDMPTVATVTWTTDLPTIGAVSFGEVGGTTWQTKPEAEATTEHRAVLVGLPEGVEAELRILASAEDGTASSDPVAFETGTFDAAVPRPYLDRVVADTSSGGFTLAPMQDGDSKWIAIVDPDGRLVWAWGGAGLETQRARLTHDGQGLVLATRAPEEPDLELIRLDWDGTERWRHTMVGAHHDFDLVDDETFVALVGLTREVDGPGGPVTVLGDGLIEESLDGAQRTLWEAWDHLDVDTQSIANTSLKYEGALDWSHGNYVRYDAERDAVHVVLREVSAVAEVDLESGDTNWLLADNGGDFDDPTDDRLLRFPHSAWPLPDGVLVFNQRDSGNGECAEVVAIDLDQGEELATEAWSYRASGCLQVHYLGNAQPLSGGRLLVSFANTGVLEEVEISSGQPAWRLTAGGSASFLYVERFAAFGTNLP